MPLERSFDWREGDPRWAASWGRTGVTLTHVEPGSPAARAGLRAGDVVFAIDLRPTTDADSLQYALGVSPAQLGRPVGVNFVRDGARMDTALKLDEPSKSLGVVKALATER